MKYSSSVANVVVTFNLHKKINTFQIYEEWYAREKFQAFKIRIYDDDSITGWLDILYKKEDRKINIRLYPTGKGFISGAKSEEEARQTLDKFVSEL